MPHTEKPPIADLVLQTETVYYWDTAEEILRKWFSTVELEYAVANKKVHAAYTPVAIEAISEKKAKLCKRFKAALTTLEGEIAKIDPEMRSGGSAPASPTSQKKHSPIAPEPKASPLSIALAWRWGTKLLEVEAAALESGMPPSSIAYLRDGDNWAHITVLAALRYQYQSVLLELLPLEKEVFESKAEDSSSSSALISMLKENTKDALLGVSDCCKNAASLKGIGAVEQSHNTRPQQSSPSPSQNDSSSTLTDEERFAINFFECEIDTISTRYQLVIRQPDEVTPVVATTSAVNGGVEDEPAVDATTAAQQPPPAAAASGGCVIM